MPQPISRSGSVWRRHSGRTYTVVITVNTKGEIPNPKYPPTVVYYGENGHFWTGPLDDWHRRMTFVSGEASQEVTTDVP